LDECELYLRQRRRELGIPDGPTLAEQRERYWRLKLERFETVGLLPN
jgi:hypothetical protein